MSDARLHRCRQALHAYEELYMHAALSNHSSCTESEAVSSCKTLLSLSCLGLHLLLLAVSAILELGPLQGCQP